MITLRRAGERHPIQRRKQEVWLTFHARDRADPLADGFGALAILDEHRLPPGAVIPREPYREVEMITYVREGALAHEDSMGRSGVIHAGEFQRMPSGRGNRHSEANASRTEWAHVFQIGLHSADAHVERGHESKRFCTADRRGVLCVVASPDGREGSLRIHEEVFIHSAMLDRGQHVVHELSQGRSAWLHVVQGGVSLGDVILTTGDGTGINVRRAVSLTAREVTEVLLLDLGEPAQALIDHWSVPTIAST